ncbi:RyR domain-containing protein [Novosphingobium sp.]|uniref:RyR domain-containing protein n=1 Tax=Novosphingobium sp. TaxID=1874826 RepID=UPI0038B86C07
MTAPPRPNRSARLARWAMQRAWRPAPWSPWLLGGLVGAVWLVTSVWAVLVADLALRHPPGWPRLIGDLIYGPVTFLFPSTSFVLVETLDWQTQVARFAGLLFAAMNVVWVLRRRVLTWLARALLRRAQGHAVLTGHAGSADALAIASSAQGQVVALIDAGLASDAARAARLGAAGVIGLSGPDRTYALLRQAHGTAAATIAISESGDAESLATAIALRPLLAPLPLPEPRAREVLLSIGSPATQRALRHAPALIHDGKVRFRPFSPEGVVVRAALANADLVKAAATRGQPRVAVCLWGQGPALPWAAEHMLRQNWSIHLHAPHLLLGVPFGHAPNALADDAALAHFAAHLAQVFAASDLPAILPLAEAQAGRHGAITRHIVDLGSDDATLAFALRLAAALRQAEADPAPVQPVLRATLGTQPLFTAADLALLPPIEVGAALTLEQLVARPQDEAAAHLHLAYAQRYGGDGVPASGRWQDLAETYVAANRAAADHRAVKAWDAAQSALTGPQLVEALAMAEHNRWCAERLLDGWITSPPGQRDNQRRMHPDLVPWASLPETARAKDREQVGDLLGS